MEKKKLLYVVRYQLDKPFNLKAKFDGQIAAFKKLGFDVFYLAFDETHFYLVNGEKKTVIGNTNFQIPGYYHTLCYQSLYALARKVLRDISFHCVYWRFAPLLPAGVSLAKTIKRAGARFVFEYPTYPVDTEKPKNVLRAIYGAYASSLRKKLDDLADGFVLIGEDAGGQYNGKPAINISNGVDLDVIPVRDRKPDPNAIHLLALASMSYWHGYDRLIRSLAEYQGSEKVMVHMVGGNDGGCVPEWKALAEQLGLTDRIVFHGSKTGNELNEMFDLCDVGINSLGMYRKGFSVTSELKSREYAARGLPFVCSVYDPVLEKAEKPMWLRVSNDDAIPDMEQIVLFARKTRQNPNSVVDLRAFAREHLTWESQYREVFDKFDI